MVSFENHQYTLKLSQPLTKNKTKKRRIVLKSYLTAARQGLHKNREAILMAFSDMQISKTRELKITCMHNSRQYIQYIQRNLTFCINMNLMNRPNRPWTVPRGKTAKLRVMPVIQCNGAHVQIFWSVVNKSSARTIRAQRGASWIYTQVKFLANEKDKIPPARIFDTFDKFLTVDLRLYFSGEQPKPQFPASKIFSVEEILRGTVPLGAPEYLLNNIQTAPHDIF